jgi:hypothetical protein
MSDCIKQECYSFASDSLYKVLQLLNATPLNKYAAAVEDSKPLLKLARDLR